MDNQIILITTSTCPNCKQAVNILKNNDVNFIEYDAMEHRDLVDKYKIKSCPTVIDNSEVFVGLSDIIKHFEK